MNQNGTGNGATIDMLYFSKLVLTISMLKLDIILQFTVLEELHLIPHLTTLWFKMEPLIWLEEPLQTSGEELKMSEYHKICSGLFLKPHHLEEFMLTVTYKPINIIHHSQGLGMQVVVICLILMSQEPLTWEVSNNSLLETQTLQASKVVSGTTFLSDLTELQIVTAQMLMAHQLLTLL